MPAPARCTYEAPNRGCGVASGGDWPDAACYKVKANDGAVNGAWVCANATWTIEGPIDTEYPQTSISMNAAEKNNAAEHHNCGIASPPLDHAPRR